MISRMNILVISMEQFTSGNVDYEPVGEQEEQLALLQSDYEFLAEAAATPEEYYAVEDAVNAYVGHICRIRNGES